MNDNEIPDNIFEDKGFIEKALYNGARAAWCFMGGMIMLMFMSENLYQENILYPYAAIIVGAFAFFLAVVFDAAYKKMKGIE